METTLTSIYLDPSLSGLDAVYRAVKEKGKNKISRKQVRDWLSQQDVYTLQKRQAFNLFTLINRLYQRC